jgi:hypothetical protein
MLGEGRGLSSRRDARRGDPVDVCLCPIPAIASRNLRNVTNDGGISLHVLPLGDGGQELALSE